MRHTLPALITSLKMCTNPCSRSYIHEFMLLGEGVKELFPEIIRRIKAPIGNPNAPLKAVLSQSWHDMYKGVVCLVKIIDGSIKKGDVVATYVIQRKAPGSTFVHPRAVHPTVYLEIVLYTMHRNCFHLRGNLGTIRGKYMKLWKLDY